MQLETVEFRESMERRRRLPEFLGEVVNHDLVILDNIGLNGIARDSKGYLFKLEKKKKLNTLFLKYIGMHSR